MKVSQLLEESNKFKMKCPRCGREELIPIEDIEEVEDEVFDNNTELQ